MNRAAEIPKADLDRILAQSAKTAQAPVKRKRGRPSNAELAERAAQEGAPQPQAVQAEPGVEPPSPIPIPLIVTGITMLSEIPVAQTGFRGWEVSKEEAETLAPLVDQVLKKHLPADIQQAAPEWVLALTVGGMVIARVIAYGKWKRDQVKEWGDGPRQLQAERERGAQAVTQ